MMAFPSLPDGPLSDPRISADGLSVANGVAIAALHPGTVFRFADRRCRANTVPEARDLLLRSSAFRTLGQDDAALRDLRSALARDPADPLVLRSLLSRSTDPAERKAAADALIANPRAGDGELDAALRFLASAGSEVLLRVHRSGRLISGWVAWTGDQDPVLNGRHEGGSLAVVLQPLGERRRFPSYPGRIASFAFEHEACEPVELTASAGGGETAVARIYPASPPPWPGRGSNKTAQPGPVALNVIVPLYRDAEATKACLDALARQVSAHPIRFILIDDHSPESEVSALAERFCRMHGATHIVNAVNHGFAGAVNKAIVGCGDGDYLLLNSDVTLPAEALDRLIRAAYGSADIGTVMPLSNDSELSSFPIPCKPDTLPSPDLLQRIDDAARRANADAVVDLLNPIGFCLYIKRECLFQTGLLSQDYGRGYYEDVEIGFKAREKGYRNVAAVGLYVSHGSGRSFRAEKPSLVSHNLPVVCDRFPTFRSETAAFIAADPLRPARSAMEEHLPPGQPTHLLVGAAAPAGAALSFRARKIAAEGGFALMLSWRRDGTTMWIDIRAAEGFGPRSLSFAPAGNGLQKLGTYIMALKLVQIELCDLHAMPPALYRLLLRTSAPILFYVASLEDALLIRAASSTDEERLTSRDIAVDFLQFDSASDPFAFRIPQFLVHSPATSGASRVLTGDSMAEAFCAGMRDPGGRRPAKVPDADGPRFPLHPLKKRIVAVPMPVASPAVESLLLDIARYLRPRAHTLLVVMGRCLDDRRLMAVGNVHVTGGADPDDYSDLIESYQAEGLFLPYRTSMFGILETLSETSALPRAYFDWSEGLMPRRPDDFVLDCRLRNDIVCVGFARWCAPTGSAPEVQPCET